MQFLLINYYKIIKNVIFLLNYNEIYDKIINSEFFMKGDYNIIFRYYVIYYER